MKIDLSVEEEAFELVKVLLEKPGVPFVEDTVGLSKDPMKLPLWVGEQVHHEAWKQKETTNEPFLIALILLSASFFRQMASLNVKS